MIRDKIGFIKRKNNKKKKIKYLSKYKLHFAFPWNTRV